MPLHRHGLHLGRAILAAITLCGLVGCGDGQDLRSNIAPVRTSNLPPVDAGDGPVDEGPGVDFPMTDTADASPETSSPETSSPDTPRDSGVPADAGVSDAGADADSMAERPGDGAAGFHPICVRFCARPAERQCLMVTEERCLTGCQRNVDGRCGAAFIELQMCYLDQPPDSWKCVEDIGPVFPTGTCATQNQKFTSCAFPRP